MTITTTLPRWPRIVAPLAAIWYAFGLFQAVSAYVADAASAPVAIWIAYAAACVAGIIGSAALFFAPAPAPLAFAISLVAAALYFGWLFVFGAPLGEDYGIGAMVIAVTLVLLMASRRL